MAANEATRRTDDGDLDDVLIEASRRRIGTVIDGKYRLDDLLGVGTTGAVFRAQNQWAGRPCAVKLFHYQGPNEQDVLRRFLREAQAIHRVRRNNRLHPNVVDALDVGRDRDTGTYFVVQELLRGETLATYLSRIPGHRLSAPNAVRVLRPVIDAVACAHEGSVVHRDLKPENILLTRGEGGIVPKVLDFGIAQLGEERVTPVTEFMGTPVYMPPEAFGGAGYVDARADVWALGVMLYEVLSGANPFMAPGASPMACMELVLQRTPPSLAAQGLVSPPLWGVLRRALTRAPARRFSDARELLVALDAACRPVRLLRVTQHMGLDDVREALRDPSRHAVASAPAQRPASMPPVDRRTIPPPSMSRVAQPAAIGQRDSLAGARASMFPPAQRESMTHARVSLVPAPDEGDEPFTGDPADYWWSVQMQGPHTADDIAAVLSLPELAHVIELHVTGARLDDAGVLSLCESPLLRDLAVLSLRRMGLTARAASHLAMAPSLANVLKLDVEHCPIGNAGLASLVGSRHLADLRALSAVDAGLDAGAADVLVQSARLHHLLHLDLSQNHLGDAGAVALAMAPKLAPELTLALSRNRVSLPIGERLGALLHGRIRRLVL